MMEPLHTEPEFEVRLSARADQVLQAVAAGAYASPAAYRLQLEAERLQLISGFDQLVSLEMLGFTPFDYQVRAAQIALTRLRGRGLLCDEVGLGKTIEAGLVLKEYLQRQMVQRVLILTPPALVEQWRDELASKFRLDDFVTSFDPEFRALGAGAWASYPRVVASLATARRLDHRRAIEAQNYDLVIVDEAHHLKNRASASWKLVNELHKKYILFLTATPVQNSLDELYNLITILKPGQLRTPREFQRQFVVQGDPRLPKNRGRLRELLADVMIRNSRGQVSVKLPPRHAHTIRLPLTTDEFALYQNVSAFVRAESGGRWLATTDGDGEEDAPALSSTSRFVLQTLQREIGSSPLAARPTLLALAGRESLHSRRAALRALAEQAESLKTWAKAEALEKLLQAQASEKVIVFTHFRPTLDALAARLRGLGLDIVVYHGGMAAAEKDAAIRRFERDGRILLSTEAAGEGRNLQFCRTMINFDLPWNPMRIEQRVGRIHRIGQTREVNVFNLSAANTIEDYLLDILDRKLNMFELVVGEMDMILGQLTGEQDFEDLVMDIWVRSATADDASAGFDQLGEALVAARSSYQRTQEYDEALFGQDFSAA